MPQMRILVISPYFAPSPAVGAKRFSFLAREWARSDHDVEVITLHIDRGAVTDASLPYTGHVRAVSSLLPVARHGPGLLSRAYDRFATSVIGYPDPFVVWLPAALREGRRVIRDHRPDVIVATGPPFTSFVVGSLLSRSSGAPLVLDYRDPWTRYPWKPTPRGRRMQSPVRRAIEDWCVNVARAFVFASLPMQESFHRLSGDRNIPRGEVITNGYDPVAGTDPHELTPGAVNVLYAGNFYGERRLSGIAEAAARLAVQRHTLAGNIVFHVFGKVSREDRERLANILAPTQLVEHAPVPHAEILRYMLAADVLFLPSGTDVPYALPYKVFDYLSAGRPILAVTPRGSAVESLMAQIDCGEVATSDDPACIAEALERLLERRATYTFSGRDTFTWQEIGRRYEQFLLEVTRG